MKNASLFSLSISKDSSFLLECQMIGREEKGNFDKKEEVSDFPVNKNRVGKKKRFEEVYGSIFRNLGTKKAPRQCFFEKLMTY
ncbi:TPA: hypothetical protein IWL22_001735 [Enterococcus faecium]|nr:hypothetical protein [Enterococcus faecium]